MQRKDFVKLLDEHFATITEINRTKGHDYAGDDDALANFKLAGEKLGLTPEKIWGVYADKHWSAVMTFVKEGDVKSEPIEGRLHDVILYSFLLLGLIAEKKGYPRTMSWEEVATQLLGNEVAMLRSADPVVVRDGLQAITERLDIDGIMGSDQLVQYVTVPSQLSQTIPDLRHSDEARDELRRTLGLDGEVPRS